MLEDAGVSLLLPDGGRRDDARPHDAPQRPSPRAADRLPRQPHRRRPRARHRGAHRPPRSGPANTRCAITITAARRRSISPPRRRGRRASRSRSSSSTTRPGAFLFESDKGESGARRRRPGRYRTDEKEAANALAQKRLAAQRASRGPSPSTRTPSTSRPATVVSFLDHPKSELAPGKGFLVTGALERRGERQVDLHLRGRERRAPLPPAPRHAPAQDERRGERDGRRPRRGEEIHTDEFGRVRVHFHWDRESQMNESSSCWIHVSQPWGGSGFGGTNLPRIGQEVIVDFLGGDPDRPIIVGRVYTNLQKTPYKLPDNKTQSGWKSRSSPGGGGDNYNEIMFEDKKGQELVRMQAEKDLDKLVKNDEKVKIGHDRTKQVGHDDALTVGRDRTRPWARRVGEHRHQRVVAGHDRTREVGNDETVTVGHDRTRTVANDETVDVGSDQSVSVARNRTRMVGMNESITIGANNTRAVAMNETLFVGVNQTEQIGGNRSVKVKKSHSEKIGKAKTVKVGKAKTETVGLASTETVGLAKTLTVGAAYTVTVGGVMNTNVAMTQSEKVGLTKTVTVGQSLTITCGAASIVLEASGKIAIKGAEITVNGKTVTIEAEEGAKLKGATTKIEGDPIDLN
jgi:type VI secretion system secreted protein VgrG